MTSAFSLPFSTVYGTFDELSEAFPGAPVVERQAGLALLLHTEAGRLDFGEGEAEVLVQVVQLVDEVSHIPAKHLISGEGQCLSVVQTKYNLI